MRAVCGLDVHKDSVYLCILSSTGEIYEKKFGVLTTELIEMRDLMLSHHVLEVGMDFQITRTSGNLLQKMLGGI